MALRTGIIWVLKTKKSLNTVFTFFKNERPVHHSVTGRSFFCFTQIFQVFILIMYTATASFQLNPSVFPRRAHNNEHPPTKEKRRNIVAPVVITGAIANSLATPTVYTEVTNANEPTNKKTKIKPTAGMKAFDTVLYPILTNAAVFAISVFATYQTTHGNKNTAVGRFFRVRGENLVNWFKGETKLFDKIPSPFKMSHQSADMAKMVTFSFIDGTLMAPAVVLLENYSVPISKKLDALMGTEPKDDAPYKEREKRHQGWGSVLTGRLATCAIVVPTAVALDRKVGAFGNKSLNAILFEEPGQKLGEYVQQKYPAVQQKYPNLNIPYLGKTIAFEAFYTSVCTAGLYVSSRLLTGPIADTFKAWKEKGKPATATTATPTTVQPQVQYA
jgi:hypothetical protein